MTTAALIAAAGATKAAGQLFQGFQSYRNAQYQSDALQAEARAKSMEAGSEVQVGLEDSARKIGEGVTIAAKGGGLGGSAGDVLADLARQAMFRARATASTGAAEANARMVAARQTRQAAKLALVGTGFKLAGTVLSTAMGASGAQAQSAAFEGL